MCGICGFTGQPNNRLLKKMTNLLIHRGPDEQGFYSNGKINFGMRRLSIIDIQTGHQPISNETGQIVAIFNGEIYNYKELRKELLEKGHKFKTKSDTEVILHLYEELGIEFVHRLNGMFAIALWDSFKKQLILVRDRIGIKPLYYFFKNKEIIFGSEIKAILTNPVYEKDIDFEALHHFLSFKHIPAPKSIFKNIFTLLPGELLIFKKGSIRKKKYWQLTFNEDISLDEKETAEKILDILTDSVKIRMRSDVPIGAYLSGGVDSSSIVALMSRFTNQPINTFCLGYKDKFSNKLADFISARKIAKLYNTNHHEYIMSWEEIPEKIEQIIESFDEPFIGVISTFFISQLIKKHVKVVLSGDGGDELFGSYLSHRLAQPMAYYFKLKEKEKLNRQALELLSLSNSDKEMLLKIADKRPWAWRAKHSVFNEQEKSMVYSRYLKSKTKKLNSERLWKKYFNNTTTNDPLNQVLEAEFKTVFPDQVLAFVDRLSMAHSIELRTPFLDYRLVEFIATIPGNLKIKNNIVKYILKKAVKDLIPEEITNRPKEGFILPINQWLLKNMESYVKSILLPKRIRKHGFFNENTINNLIKHYYQKQDIKNSNKIWSLVTFQLWWEKYF